MTRAGIARSACVVAVVGLFIAFVGCEEYFTKPLPDKWTVSEVPGHLAVVFNGENDTSDAKYEFSNSGPGSFNYTLARVALSFQLEEGTAKITISYAGQTENVVQTEATPGWGPWVRFDLEENVPGIFEVHVETFNAKGMITVNLDEVDPTKAGARIGFEYVCTFPDSYPTPVDRTELYHWSWGTGQTDPELRISASQAMDFATDNQFVTVDLQDGASAGISNYPFDNTNIPPDGFVLATNPFQIISIGYDPVLKGGYERRTWASAGAVGNEQFTLSAYAAGYWRIHLTYSQQQADAGFDIKLIQLP